MLKRLAQSVGITIAVSSILAWPFIYIGVNFFSGLAFFTVLQFVAFYFYSEHIRKKMLIEEEKLVILREAELSKQGAEVVCPCDRQVKAFVPILLNGRNEFTCPGCKKNINVAVNLKTALITTPILEDMDTVIRSNLVQ